MTKQQLAKEIKSIALLKGSFTLSSGQTSREYFDKYLFESFPALLKVITVYMKKLIPADTEVLAGLEMGGIPLVTALSLETGLPCVFVRKKAKGYGTRKISEGCSVRNKKLCIVEDIITTGGQLILSTEELRKEGADVQQSVCVIFRGKTNSLENIQSKGLQLQALFRSADILN